MRATQPETRWSREIVAILRSAHTQPGRISAKIAARLWGLARNPWRRRMAHRRATYGLGGEPTRFADVSYYRAPALDVLEPRGEILRHLVQRTLEHRFDVLGSGWVEVRHGMSCAGLEQVRYPPERDLDADAAGHWIEARINRANRERSRALWRLIRPPYTPIDWQIDLKSGYRWSERTWFGDIRFGDRPGVDVKVPWELARLHHLPWLALAHALTEVDGEGVTPTREALVDEFRNQVLDFLAANPPGFGVNWACAMDVAIRAVNILVARDLFRSTGATLDAEVEQALARGIADHGWHIAQNLEWVGGHRGNHYLADIVGLLFISAYLPSTPRTDTWLAFAIQQLGREIEFQFHPEGSNAEGSTGYHRLSAEMAAHGAALVTALPAVRRRALVAADPALGPRRPPLERSSGDKPAPPLSAIHLERLHGAAEFLETVCRPDGTMVLIGDMDSGRLLKLDPRGDLRTAAELRTRYASLADWQAPDNAARWWDETDADAMETLAVLAVLLGRDDLQRRAGGPGIAGAALAPHARAPAGPRARPVPKNAGDAGQLEALWRRAKGVPTASRREVQIPLPFDPGEGLQAMAYEQFGLYVLRSPRLLLTFRCGPPTIFGFGAHVHNDQLGLTLSVDGRDWLVDPGSYLYTPFVDLRDEDRSVRAHTAPALQEGEPSPLDAVFRHSGSAQATCASFGVDGMGGWHEGYGVRLTRLVLVEADGLRVVDFAEGGRPLLRVEDRPDALQGSGTGFSPGYGKRLNPEWDPRCASS